MAKLERWGEPNKYMRNWPEYNEPLVKRGKLYLSLNFVEQWDQLVNRENTGKNGHLFIYPGLFIQWMACIHSIFQMPYRHYVHSPKTPLSPNMEDNLFYCQGWIWQETKYGPLIWHSGAVGGYHNYIAYSPKEKIGIVILTNNVEASLSDAMFYQFFSMYFGDTTSDFSGQLLKARIAENAAAVTTEPAFSAGAHPPLSLPAYAGTYTNTPYGTAIVSEQNGNLSVTMGPAQQKLLLVQGNGNTFIVSGTPGNTRVSFDVDKDNNVKSMTVPFGHATPLFIRV